MNEKIMSKEMGVNKVSEVSTVSEVSKMSKQGEQQSLHSLLPLGEGGRRPDEGADVVRSYTLGTGRPACTNTQKIAERNAFLNDALTSGSAMVSENISFCSQSAVQHDKTRHGAAEPASCKSLVPQCLSNLVPFRKAAFTLAEVLITLAVIGIVAALTIPSLVQSYKERVTITKVKKAYTTLTNALQLAIIENGTVDNWGLTGVYEDEDGNAQISQEGSTKFARIFSKYLNKSTICEGDVDCIGGYDQKLMNGDEYTIGAQGASAVVLNDGTGVAFTPWTDNCENRNVGCGSIAIYTNLGHTAQYGVNTFAFTLYKDRIVPWGARNQLDPNNYFSAKCKYNGGNFENGLACTGWVIEVGNMDYLHCDGLSWDGKHSCKE